MKAAKLFTFLAVVIVLLQTSTAPIPENFKNFIKEDIIEYYRGRANRDQFAVLFMSHANSLSQVPGTVDYDVDHFVFAQPDYRRHIHAEQFLLPQVDELWNHYRETRRTSPTKIILYTWLSPCSGCTEAIANEFADDVENDVDVIVVYTLNYKGETPQQNNANRNYLRDHGITVLKVFVPRDEL